MTDDGSGLSSHIDAYTGARTQGNAVQGPDPSSVIVDSEMSVMAGSLEP